MSHFADGHTESNRVVLLGAGGHARVLIEIARFNGLEVVALLDDNPSLHGKKLDGVAITGGIDTLDRFDAREVTLVNAIGSAGLPNLRKQVVLRRAVTGFSFATLVHTSATISSSAELAGGAQIIAGAVVGPAVSLGAHTILNTCASVDHDVTVGDFTHIAPGATVCGGCCIGPNCHIGCGATLIQGVCIGQGVLIAAGAVVTSDLPDGARVGGVPAKLI